MTICFIADMRSSIARSWIEYFITAGHNVHVVSTFPCAADAVPGGTTHVAGAPFTGVSNETRGVTGTAALVKFHLNNRDLLGRCTFWGWNALYLPSRCLALAAAVKRIVEDVRPDLLHCLRIPIEGELGALVNFHPLFVSVWGNDFTLYADRFRSHSLLTTFALKRTDGLLADTTIDINRARQRGLAGDVPTLRVPGCGGVRADIFYPGRPTLNICKRLGIQPGGPVIVNPRGFRPYVRNDVFFSAIPRILRACPEARFVGVGLSGWKHAEQWIQRYGVSSSVTLTGSLTSTEMAELFNLASVSVSPAEHDGTPNTLLEAMACGCFPVCGDLPAIREWIHAGENGLLFDPADPEALATCVIDALRSDKMRHQGARVNTEMIKSSADYDTCMPKAEMFYEQVACRVRSARGIAVCAG